MAGPNPVVPNPPPNQGAPQWAVMLSAIFGGIALLFLMAIIVLAALGVTVPDNNRYLIVFFFALAGALAFGFIGGTAAANGNIPIPFVRDHPIGFSVGGGVAVLVILLLLGPYILPSAALPVLVRIDGVTPFALADNPDAVRVQVDYFLQGWVPPELVVVEAAWDKNFTQIPFRKNLDRPTGQTTFDLPLAGAKGGTPFWVRVQVQDENGHVRKQDVKDSLTPKS